MSGLEKCKITQEQKKEIIKEIRAGKTKSELAIKYGIDRSTIYRYLKKKPTKNIWRKKRKAIIEAVKDKTNSLQSIADKYGVKLSTVSYYYFRGIRRNDKTEAKNYKDYLEEENKKRKEKGWYNFKIR